MATRPRKPAQRAATPRRHAAELRANAAVALPARVASARRAQPPARAASVHAEGRTPSAHDELVAAPAAPSAPGAATARLKTRDPATLFDQEFERWARAVNQADLAIARARKSLLGGIADPFETELPATQRSRARMKTYFGNVNQAVAIIGVVSGTPGVIEQAIRPGL